MNTQPLLNTQVHATSKHECGFLIDNIESAFNEWRNNPLLVNLSFDDFKEAILPYRTGNEHLPFTKTALKTNIIIYCRKREWNPSVQ